LLVVGSGKRNGCFPIEDAVQIQGDRDSENPLCLAMEFVVTELVHDIKRNQDAAGHADRKTSNIDERVGGILVRFRIAILR